MKLCVALLLVLGVWQAGAEPGPGLQGYAGPGWSFLLDADGTMEVASLGPVMFRVSETLFVGPTIAYEESASTGPDSFLGGAKLEAYFRGLSRGFYATSAAVSALAGVADLSAEGSFAAQLNAQLDANLQLFPSFILGVGPVLAVRLQSSRLAFRPGFSFSLKEGALDYGRPLVRWNPEGPRVGGYWQGLWTYVNGRPVFIDGGGTRVELRNGLAFGITGGVLRQNIQQSGSDLAIMLTGVTTEWNARIARWLTVTPRVAAGLGMYGWAAADGAVDGAAHFVLRPELCAYLGLLPFLEVGGGIGYQLVTGEPATAIPLQPLSSLAFSVQARVGHR